MFWDIQCTKTSFCDIDDQKRWGQNCPGAKFCMLLSRYKFKVQCFNFRVLNVIPIVTTKKIVAKYAQKEMRRKLKCFTTKKNQLNTKEESNTGNEK